MDARADAAELTGERIVDAMLTRFESTPYERIRLEDIASDAAVTSQTVIRRFGGKPGLMVATVQREMGRIMAAREAAAHAPPAETLHALVQHYERYGRLILKTYAEAPLVPGLPELVTTARAYHVQWCRQAFADDLDVATGAATAGDGVRQRRLAQIAAICDATTWRILRDDGGLDTEQTEQALAELLMPLLRQPA